MVWLWGIRKPPEGVRSTKHQVWLRSSIRFRNSESDHTVNGVLVVLLPMVVLVLTPFSMASPSTGPGPGLSMPDRLEKKAGRPYLGRTYRRSIGRMPLSNRNRLYSQEFRALFRGCPPGAAEPGNWTKQ